MNDSEKWPVDERGQRVRKATNPQHWLALFVLDSPYLFALIILSIIWGFTDVGVACAHAAVGK